jgi:hypothetical protein
VINEDFMEREKFNDDDEFPEESEEIVDHASDSAEDDEDEFLEEDYDPDEDEDYDENDEEDRRHLYRRKKDFSWDDVEELDFSKSRRRDLDAEAEE